ncbi:hypothetical protein ACVR1G_00960 [Streptococcus dentasini]
MIIKINKDSILALILYLVLAVYLFFAVLNASFFVQIIPDAVFKLVNYSLLAIMILVEVTDFKLSKQSLLVAPILLILLLIAVRTAGVFSNISVMILFSFFYRKFPLENLVKVAVFSSSLALSFIVFSSLLGIIPNYLEQTPDRIRHYIGFRYALFPSAVLLNIISGRFFIKKNQVSLLELFVLFAINFWVYYQTNSRLTYYSVTLLLIIWIILKYYPNLIEKMRPLLSLFILSYPASFLLSLWFSFKYTPVSSFQLFLNGLFGNRLYLMHKSMELYGFKLTGQQIDWVGNGLNTLGRITRSRYLYVDNLYMQMLQQYGLIISLAFVLGMTIVMVRLYQRRDMYLFIILISLALHGLVDDLIGNIHYNIFLLVFGILYIEQYRLNRRNTEEI